jgi:glutathione S-transferase
MVNIPGPLKVHGLDLSYFTGKLEGYLRVKGIPYELCELNLRSFGRCARATGVAQMPQVELADGTWLLDTPRIIDYFETSVPSPAVTPSEPVARMAAKLLEAFGDEWLWRPALYYRWAFAQDARLLGERLARGMFGDVPAPKFLVARYARLRQRYLYLRGEGVTRRSAGAVEAQYLATLDVLQAMLADHPYVMGARPSEADLGFFGPLFRHFFCDPTPARIMREGAPAVAAWVTRIWNAAPAQFAAAPALTGIPAFLRLLTPMVDEFLAYLDANARAFEAGRADVAFTCHGGDFRTAVSPYRVWRLARLQAQYAKLLPQEREAAVAWLSSGGKVLAGTVARPAPDPIPALPIQPQREVRAVDRAWRPQPAAEAAMLTFFRRGG